jgi:hypothetical protein
MSAPLRSDFKSEYILEQPVAAAAEGLELFIFKEKIILANRSGG